MWTNQDSQGWMLVGLWVRKKKQNKIKTQTHTPDWLWMFRKPKSKQWCNQLHDYSWQNATFMWFCMNMAWMSEESLHHPICVNLPVGLWAYFCVACVMVYVCLSPPVCGLCMLSYTWIPAGICLHSSLCVSEWRMSYLPMSPHILFNPQPPATLLHSWLWGFDLMLSDDTVLSVILGTVQLLFQSLLNESNVNRKWLKQSQVETLNWYVNLLLGRGR